VVPNREKAFTEKFGMPSDRAINELGGGGKPQKAVALKEQNRDKYKEKLRVLGYSLYCGKR